LNRPSAGERLFGTTDYDSIISRSRARPENHFNSKDELLAYSREVLTRAKTSTATLVDRMPLQDAAAEVAVVHEAWPRQDPTSHLARARHGRRSGPARLRMDAPTGGRLSVSSGRFNAKAADDVVDRIAVLPGQLTSYDSGGLEELRDHYGIVLDKERLARRRETLET
jgi:uncharacterized protein (DUF885 family)